jgi:hypothetical protein
VFVLLAILGTARHLIKPRFAYSFPSLLGNNLTYVVDGWVICLCFPGTDSNSVLNMMVVVFIRLMTCTPVLIQLLSVSHSRTTSTSYAMYYNFNLSSSTRSIHWRCVTNALTTNDDCTRGFIFNLKLGIRQLLCKPYRRSGS